MYIEQIYTNCLAEAAYYIESNGEVAIIDPLREVQPYIEKAKARHAKIKYVFETHFHADFVSGHVDLAEATGATIVYGPTTLQTGFKAHIAYDGELFQLGNIKIKLIHTPGHTMESSCYLLYDENEKETALFTGDTLFIGDVGRPDLAQHVIAELTQEKLAGHLYDSLRNKIMPLSDELIIYPGHGVGSACGKNMSKETSGKLGHQKIVNYALRPNLTKAEFIKVLLDGLMPPPGYFPQNVLLNIKGYQNVNKVIHNGTRALTVSDFLNLLNSKNAVVIDTRKAEDFSKAFIPNSINIGLNGNLAVWVGTLVPKVTQAILLICDKGTEEEVVTRLSRVGYDNTLGFLNSGMETWIKEKQKTDKIQTIDAQSFYTICQTNPDINILDVRKQSEYDSEHIVGAVNTPLDYINNNNYELDKTKPYYVHCAGGYRSMSFISIMKTKGYHNLIDIGGLNALKAFNQFNLTAFQDQVTML